MNREFYEDLWAALPEDLSPPDLAPRRGFLLDRVAPGERVLDLGCGDGWACAALADHGAVPVAVDVAEAALARARARVPGLDARRAPVGGPLPVADGAVAVAWCSEVLEHVADVAGLLSEVRRVLAPGGRLLVTTPYHGRVQTALAALAGFERRFDPLGDHLRFFTRRSLAGVLRDFGFDGVAVRPAGGPPLRRRLLLAEGRRAAPALAGRRP